MAIDLYSFILGKKLSNKDQDETKSEGWQPPSDWWDIENILKNDVQEGYTPRYIFLVADTSNTISFPGSGNATVGGTAWKTSDGQFYTSTTTHTWDKTKDKPCSKGYKTRYVIVYSATRDISLNHRNIPSLFVYFGDCNITGMVFGGSNTPRNTIIQSIKFNESTTASSTFNSNAFYGCGALSFAPMPNGANSISGGSFANCYNLETITIPSTITSINDSGFSGCYALISVNLPDDFDLAASFSASAYYMGLAVSSMLDMFARLKDNTGLTAKTLTLGYNNLAKLTDEEKAIATNKNWTLA